MAVGSNEYELKGTPRGARIGRGPFLRYGSLDLAGQAEEVLEGQYTVPGRHIESFPDLQELDVTIQKGHVVMVGATMPLGQLLPLGVRMGPGLPLVDPAVVADKEHARRGGPAGEGQARQP